MGEQKIADRRGKYLYAIQGGRKLRDATWTEARIVVTSERLVVFGVDGEKLTVDLSAVDEFEDRCDVNQACASEPAYTALRIGEDVLLLSADDQRAFEIDLYSGALTGAHVYVKHPAVVGGVVQDDASFMPARLKISAERMGIVLKDGGRTSIAYDDVGEFVTADREIDGAERTVLKIEHSEEGRSVETHVVADHVHSLYLVHLVETSLANVTMDADDLSATEIQALIALYSGIEPWEVPEFVGVDVERIEEIFDRLAELDVLETVRTRREVALTARGRSIADESAARD